MIDEAVSVDPSSIVRRDIYTGCRNPEANVMRRSTVIQPAKADRRDEPGGPAVWSMDDILARYPGEWIALRVTGYDDRHWPAEGEIIARARSRARAWHRLTDYMLSSQRRPGPYTVFQAVPYITTGDELRRSLAELIEQGDPPGRWPGLR